MLKLMLAAVFLAGIAGKATADQKYNCTSLPAECKCIADNLSNCSSIGLTIRVKEDAIDLKCNKNVTDFSILKDNFTESSDKVQLSLTGCSLQSVNSINELVKDLGINGIASLKISNVNFTVTKDFFTDVNAVLTSLSLNNLGMTSLDEDVFEGMTNLETLDLSGNLLQDLPNDVFTRSPNLKHLTLHHNQLKNYPETQLQSISLEYLDISFNHIKEITSKPCESETLKSLNISSNSHIDLIVKGNFVFYNCRNLEDLQVANTSITSNTTQWKRIKSDIETFNSLHTLNLSNNAFPSVQAEDIVFEDQSMANLSLTIDLSRCGVKSIAMPKDKFNSSRSIKLDLSHNKLTKLPEDIVSVVKEGKIEELRLADNHWSCTCDEKQVVVLANNYSSQIKDVRNVLCSGNVPATSLTVEDICKAHTSRTFLVVFMTLTVTILVAFALGFAFYRYRKAAHMY